MSNNDPNQQSNNLLSGQPAQVFCPRCKNENPAGIFHCQWCGKRLPTQTAPNVDQFPLLLRVAYFICIGWWLTLFWIAVRFVGFCISELSGKTKSLSAALFKNLGTVTTLQRNPQTRFGSVTKNLVRMSKDQARINDRVSKRLVFNSAVIVLFIVIDITLCAGLGVFRRPTQNIETTSSTPVAVGQIRNMATATRVSSTAEKGIKEPPVVTTIPTIQPEAIPTATPDIILMAAATQTAGAGTAGNLPSSSEQYFAYETLHSVTAFKNALTELGGVVTTGFPLTEAFIEQNSSNGKWYWVQYFEKAVFEYHPELPVTSQFQLAPLGRWRYQQKYAGATPQTAELPGSASHLFSETNHTVRDPFLKRWNEGGEVRRFGYPISESFEEKNDVDGNTYIVQYFERGVMEYHANEKAPHNVQIAALGRLKLQQLYPGGAPSRASDPQPTPSPTPTIPPTATPIPIPTTDPKALTVEEQTYVSEAQNWISGIGGYAEASNALSGYFNEMSNDPSLLFDGGWVAHVKFQLTMLEVTSDEILSYDPIPKKFQAAHGDLKVVAQDMNSAASFYRRGIDNLDSSAFTQANAKVQHASIYMQKAADKLEAMIP